MLGRSIGSQQQASARPPAQQSSIIELSDDSDNPSAEIGDEFDLAEGLASESEGCVITERDHAAADSDEATADRIIQFIKHSHFYDDVLLLEPVDLTALHAALDNEDIQCRTAALIQVLDSESITYREPPNGRSRARTKKKRSKARQK